MIGLQNLEPALEFPSPLLTNRTKVISCLLDKKFLRNPLKLRNYRSNIGDNQSNVASCLPVKENYGSHLSTLR